MLLVTPPDTIKNVKINTNFWLWLKVGVNLSRKYTLQEKASAVCYLVFGYVPEDDGEAIELFEGCLDFYNCGREDRGVPPADEQLLNWDYDSPTLWADLKIYARIDIDKVKYMHWWNFNALVQSLPSHSRIKELISIRSEDLKDYNGKGQEKIKEKKKQAKILAAVEYAGDEDY